MIHVRDARFLISLSDNSQVNLLLIVLIITYHYVFVNSTMLNLLCFFTKLSIPCWLNQCVNKKTIL